MAKNLDMKDVTAMGVLGKGLAGEGEETELQPPEAPEGSWAETKEIISAILASTKFDFVLCGVIVLNSITIGAELQLRVTDGNTLVLQIMEHIFLVFYIAELTMRFVSGGIGQLKDPWLLFDLVLVVAGVATSWVMEPFFSSSLGPMMVLRTCRLARLGKTLRVLASYPQLWMFLRGLLNSAGTMVYTLLVLAVILYVYACMGMEIISQHRLADVPEDEGGFKDHVETHFASLPLTMLSLIQFVTLDDMVWVYWPLVTKDVLLAVYFMALMLTVSIVIMNLITAVIMNSVIDQHHEDKEKASREELRARKEFVEVLRERLREDVDEETGMLCRKNFLKLDSASKRMLLEYMRPTMLINQAVDFFDAVDVEGCGILEPDVLCDTLWQALVSKAPLEVKTVERQVARMFERLRAADACQKMLQQDMVKVLKAVETSGGKVTPRLSEASTIASDFEIPSWAQEVSAELRHVCDESIKILLSKAEQMGGGSPKKGVQPHPALRNTARLSPVPDQSSNKGRKDTDFGSLSSAKPAAAAAKRKPSPRPASPPRPNDATALFATAAGQPTRQLSSSQASSQALRHGSGFAASVSSMPSREALSKLPAPQDRTSRQPASLSARPASCPRDF